MKFYKHLDLNKDFQSLLQNITPYLIKHYAHRQEFFIPLDVKKILNEFPNLQTIFNPYAITVVDLAVIVSNAQWHDFIHVDYHSSVDTDTKESDAVRINLPILNCEKSTTNYYRLKDGKQTKTDADGNLQRVIYADFNDCELIDSFRLYVPTVLRTDVLHNVILDEGVDRRMSLTVKFKENLEFFLA